MQVKSQGSESKRSIGLRFINTWSLAVLCGSVIAACSGTIDTPSQEYPARQSDSADDTSTASTGSNSTSSTRPSTPTTPARTPTPAASNADEDPPAAADEDPPAAADEDPPAAATTELSFETDIWPIFQSECGPCHVSANLGGQNIGNDDIDAALSDAKRTEDDVIGRIENGGMPPACSGGSPGDSGCVEEADLKKIEDWYAAGAPE